MPIIGNLSHYYVFCFCLCLSIRQLIQTIFCLLLVSDLCIWGMIAWSNNRQQVVLLCACPTDPVWRDSLQAQQYTLLITPVRVDMQCKQILVWWHFDSFLNNIVSCERKSLKAWKAAVFGVQFTPAVSASAKKQLMRIKFLVAASTQSGKNMSPLSSAKLKQQHYQQQQQQQPQAASTQAGKEYTNSLSAVDP